MDHPLLDDAFIAAQIEQAVGPLADQLSDEDLAWLKASLADRLQHDPAAARALAGAYPRQVDESGERVRPALVRVDETDELRRGSGST